MAKLYSSPVILPMPARRVARIGAVFRSLIGKLALAGGLSCSMACIAGAAPASDRSQTITVDARGGGPVFEGLGALSAGASSRLLVDYPEPQRSQILDYLFKPGFGAALQHLKVEIGADVNSTDGSEPSHMRSRSDHDYTRGYEWWLMLEARKRNPKIILDTLPWGAPGWIGGGKFYSTDMARYVADFIKAARQHYGLDIAYTGIWNERVHDADYVKTLHDTLVQEGLKTRIVCCDEYEAPQKSPWEIVQAMQADPQLKAAVDVVSVHYPWVYNHVTTPQAARVAGKPLWSSEDQPNSGGGPIISRDWAVGGRILAKLYNRNYLEGGFTKTEIWSPVTSYYDVLPAPNSGMMYANMPWSGHYDVQSAIWVTAHTTQFAQPGWTYDDPSSGYLVGGGSFVTLLAPDRGNWSTVIETVDARRPQAIRLQPTEGTAGKVIHVWKTNASQAFVHVSDLSLADGAYSLVVDPDSIYTVTTTTGQGKGTATPPAAAGFPLPYRDNFDGSPLARAARYLSDQDGAFEVHPCTGRKGQCLVQVIGAKPIPWDALPDPYTIAGDIHWQNYTVSVDALIPSGGKASVFGRIDATGDFDYDGGAYPKGYGVILHGDGTWHLVAGQAHGEPRVLGSGAATMGGPAAKGSWHHVDLAFEGSTVDVSIDGKQVARVVDSSHANGMFAIGSDWSAAQFDNLEVRP